MSGAGASAFVDGHEGCPCVGPSCARKLIDAIASIKSMDVILPVERNAQRVDLRLRVVAKPEKDIAVLLAHLGLQLPRRARIIENVVPKIA